MKYTLKRYAGQLISDDRFTDDMNAEYERQRATLIQVCKDKNIKLSLREPYDLTFPPDSDGIYTHQIRADFYIEGNYPENYFYVINQARPQPLKRM